MSLVGFTLKFMDISHKITGILKEKFLALRIEVIDESLEHATHKETQKTGGGHYRVVIVSEKFTGSTLLKRHRMVYDVLREGWREAIHALTLKTYTPQEWSENQKG